MREAGPPIFLDDCVAAVLDPARGEQARADIHRYLADLRSADVADAVLSWRHLPLATVTRTWMGLGRPQYGFREFTPGDVDALSTLSHASAVLCVLAHQRDGHVRERALRCLSPEPAVLPFVLPCLCDHVAQVRAAAATLVDALLPQLNALAVSRHLALLVRLRGRQRSHPLVDTLMGRLAEPRSREVTLALLDSREAVCRREAARILLAARDVDVLDGMLSSGDVVLRRQALDVLVREGPPARVERVMRKLVRSRSARLRRTALEWLLDHGVEDAPVFIARALWDVDARVRSLGQWRSTTTDPADVYRAGVAEHPAVAALGLGECGAAADTSLLLPLLDHADAHVRSAALDAWAQLDADGAVVHLQRALGDLALPVVERASRRLQKLRRVPAPTSLWPLAAANVAARTVLLDLASRGSRWGALVVLLRAAVEFHDDGTPRRIRTWLGRGVRVFTQPTSEERAEIESLLLQRGMPAWVVEGVRQAL